MATFVLIRDWWENTGYQHRIAVGRLGVTPDGIDGGHCVALSHPKDLADRLTSYLDVSGGQGPLR